jgi:hypothetical protein
MLGKMCKVIYISPFLFLLKSNVNFEKDRNEKYDGYSDLLKAMKNMK